MTAKPTFFEMQLHCRADSPSLMIGVDLCNQLGPDDYATLRAKASSEWMERSKPNNYAWFHFSYEDYIFRARYRPGNWLEVELLP
jgi:hypothetical protein